MRTMPVVILVFLACVGPLTSGQPAASAGDWPQILGPDRNGHARNESIVESLPAGGPPVVWEREVGSGLAGVSVAGDTAVLFHRLGDQEVVESLNSATGKTRWKAEFAVEYVPTFTDDNGPRCVPLIAGQRVYVFGVRGGLRCLDLTNGETVWSHETHREFSAPEGYFGAASTPILEGQRLLVNVGAPRSGAGIVAFDAATGRMLWKAVEDHASYSSPVATTVDGTRHVIFVTRQKTLSIDPATGRVRFEFRFGQRGPTVNGASPVILDGHLFVTAHYGVGAVYAKLGQASAEQLWASDEALSSHYATPIEIEGKLYGLHGQERVNPSELRCVDPQPIPVASNAANTTRNFLIHWSRRDFGYGSLIAADGKLLALLTTGELVLIRPSPSGYRELGRAKLFDSTVRALPALSNGRLYARDEQTLKCIDLRRE